MRDSNLRWTILRTSLSRRGLTWKSSAVCFSMRPIKITSIPVSELFLVVSFNSNDRIVLYAWMVDLPIIIIFVYVDVRQWLWKISLEGSLNLWPKWTWLMWTLLKLTLPFRTSKHQRSPKTVTLDTWSSLDLNHLTDKTYLLKSLEISLRNVRGASVKNVYLKRFIQTLNLCNIRNICKPKQNLSKICIYVYFIVIKIHCSCIRSLLSHVCTSRMQSFLTGVTGCLLVWES